MQVVKVADEFKDPELLDKVWVYDDGIIKGMLHAVAPIALICILR